MTTDKEVKCETCKDTGYRTDRVGASMPPTPLPCPKGCQPKHNCPDDCETCCGDKFCNHQHPTKEKGMTPQEFTDEVERLREKAKTDPMLRKLGEACSELTASEASPTKEKNCDVCGGRKVNYTLTEEAKGIEGGILDLCSCVKEKGLNVLNKEHSKCHCEGTFHCAKCGCDVACSCSPEETAEGWEGGLRINVLGAYGAMCVEEAGERADKVVNDIRNLKSQWQAETMAEAIRLVGENLCDSMGCMEEVCKDRSCRLCLQAEIGKKILSALKNSLDK